MPELGALKLPGFVSSITSLKPSYVCTAIPRSCILQKQQEWTQGSVLGYGGLAEPVLFSTIEAQCWGGKWFQQEGQVSPSYQFLTGLERRTGQESWLQGNQWSSANSPRPICPHYSWVIDSFVCFAKPSPGWTYWNQFFSPHLLWVMGTSGFVGRLGWINSRLLLFLGLCLALLSCFQLPVQPLHSVLPFTGDARADYICCLCPFAMFLMPGISSWHWFRRPLFPTTLCETHFQHNTR